MAAQSAFSLLNQRLKDLQKLKLEVIIDKNKVGPNGKNLQQTALEQELGNQKKPPCAFLRTSIETHKSQWLKSFADASQMVMQGKTDPRIISQELWKKVTHDLANDTRRFADNLRQSDESSANIINAIADSFESEP
ncbi:hypothetical protein [Bartonella sp. LJL80]